MNKKRHKALLLVGSVALILVVGMSYAWLSLSLNSDKVNVIKAGTLSLALDETASDGIELLNAVPETDDDGLNETPYKFTLKNNGDITADYTIFLDNAEISNDAVRLSDDYIKYNLKKGSNPGTPTLLSMIPTRVLDTGRLEPEATIDYVLNLWIDSSANNISGQEFAAKLRIVAKQTANNYKLYVEGDIFKIGSESFYTMSETKDTVTGISVMNIDTSSLKQSAKANTVAYNDAAGVVTNYVNSLKTTAPSVNGRLLNASELTIKQNSVNHSLENAYLFKTKYWLNDGTCSEVIPEWATDIGAITGNTCINEQGNSITGVRPVITVNKSDLN